jgi:Prophage antirepressor
MNELKIFENPEFGSVRLVEIEGEPWFVATDVCGALEVKNASQALTRLDEDEKMTTLISNEGAATGKSQMAFVNESGLYSLVLGSRKPEAKAFKRWITHDVIPTIHKHGAYMTPEAIEKVLYNPDYLIALANTLKDAQEKNKALTEQVFVQNQRIDAQTQQIAELEPKGAYYDLILQTENTMTTTQIAKDYGFSAQLFNKILHEFEIVYPQNGSWVLYQQYANSGFGKTNTYTYWKGDGENSTLSLVWTQTGRLFLYEKLKSHGILPVVETEYSDVNFSNPIVIKCQGKSSENHAKFRGIPHDIMERAYKAYKQKTSPLKDIVKALGISTNTFYKKTDKFKRFPDLRVY